ncbi:MAG: barstar family protein [Eubacteriales bacterium]|nr:barstar family protein [Eubacteriales bacterium]
MPIQLDARRMGRDEVHAYVKEKLSLPAWYGNNLDALYDCLTDLPETVVVIEHAAQADDYFRRVQRVFRAAERENTALTVHIIK